jgi:hypothetical protein
VFLPIYHIKLCFTTVLKKLKLSGCELADSNIYAPEEFLIKSSIHVENEIESTVVIIIRKAVRIRALSNSISYSTIEQFLNSPIQFIDYMKLTNSIHNLRIEAICDQFAG